MTPFEYPTNDPWAQYVHTLLSFEGNINNSAGTDYSLHTGGSATYNNDSPSASGQSIYFDGNTALTTPTEPQFSTGNFTVETWLKPTTTPTGGPDFDSTIYGTFAGTPMLFMLTNGTNNALPNLPAFWDGTVQHTSNTPLSINQWHHVAWCRSNGQLRIYLNGTKIYTGACTKSFNPSSIWVGREMGSNSRPYIGGMDDLRVTNGIARYIDDFDVADKY